MSAAKVFRPDESKAKSMGHGLQFDEIWSRGDGVAPEARDLVLRSELRRLVRRPWDGSLQQANSLGLCGLFPMGRAAPEGRR